MDKSIVRETGNGASEHAERNKTMIPIIDTLVQGLEWFSTTYPLLAYTFDGTVLTFFGIGIIGLIKGEKK